MAEKITELRWMKGQSNAMLTSNSVIKDKIEAIIVDPFNLEGLSQVSECSVDVSRLDFRIEASQLEDTGYTCSHD